MSYLYPRNLVTLSTQPASNSASIAFTSLISSNFSVYHVRLRNIVPVTNATSLLMTYSTDNGSTYLNTNYKWVVRVGDSAGFSGIINSNSDSSIKIKDGQSSTAARATSLNIDIYDLNQSTFNPKAEWIGASYDSGGNNSVFYGSGTNTTTTAITAIKFAMASGNIASGTFTLYGVTQT